jgi:hypothetical protein
MFMIRLPQRWLIYTAFLAALVILGLTAAKPLWSAAIPVSVMPPASDPNQVSEADYVQGLAKLGIVKLSGHHPSPVVHRREIERN